MTNAPPSVAPVPPSPVGGQRDAQGPGEPGTRTPGRRRRHPLVRLARFLGGLSVQILLVLVLLLGLVLGTQTGLRTAIAIAGDLAPGVLRVGRAEGRVLGRLHLEDLEIHLPDLDLHLGRFDLDWSPLAAFTGTLRIQQVAARDIDVVLGPSTDKERQPLTLPQVVLPLAIVLDEALVERLRVSQRGEPVPVFALDRADLGARFQGGNLDLRRLELVLARPRLVASTRGQVRLMDRYPLDLELDWTLDQDPAVRLQGQGRLGGDLKRLSLGYALTGSVQARLDAQVQDVLERPSWDGLIQIQGVRLPDFQADAPAVEVRGRIETRGDLDAATVTGTLDGKASDLSDFGHLELTLDALWEGKVLSLRTLDLREAVSGARFGASGALDLNPDPGAFSLKGTWERLRWPLTGDLVARSPQGRLDASGSFADYAYGLSGAAEGPGFPAVDLDLKGSGNAQGTRIGTLRVLTLDGRLEGEGELHWAPALDWDIRVRGQDLNPAGFAPAVDDRIALTLDTKGGISGFVYDLMGNSSGPGLPPARLLLAGKGDLKGTEIASLQIEALKGRIEGRARAGWDPQVTWETDLKATGIDPGAYAPDWPGRIDGRIRSQGSLEPGGPKLSAVIEGVEGTLRGYPVSAVGQVRMAEGTIRVEGFEAASGPSTARVDGTIAESLDLTFALASPDLRSLLPDAKGRFEARGRVQGLTKAPEISLRLDARDAEIAGQGIASLAGTVDLALTPQGPFQVQLDGTDLALGGLRWDRLTVRGDGNMPNHRLNLTVTGQPVAVRLEASGGLKGQGAYQGSLSRLDLDSLPYGNWRLQKPMPLGLAGPRVEAGPLCLRNGQGSGGCLAFNQTDPGRWNADLDLDPLGFEVIQGFLPPNLAAEGGARVKGRFQAAGPVLTGSAVAEIPRGRLRLGLGGAKSEELDFSAARLTLDAGAKGLDARLNLPLKGLGEVAGSLDLPGWRLDTPARPEQALRGGLRAAIAHLDRLSRLVPDLTGVTGSLDADLTLGGTLGRPGVKGQAGLRGFGAEVPLIGLKVANLDLNLLAPSMDRLDIQGQGQVGGGRLEMSGDARLGGAAGLSGRFLAQGDRLKVANTKEYFALVSPRIQVDLSPAGARVHGEIKVPEARIRPRSIPAGTVSPSSDVMLADQAKAQKSALPVEIDMVLKLGDNVTIDAFGVRGRLTGELRAFQTPGKEMLGDGQLAIEDGLYRLSGGFGIATELGAPLTIEQGRLVFAKSPIGNPGLLLQAKREGGEMSAGVRVLGSLRKPKLAFFSESDPGMSQSEITKYLLTGIPPRSDSGPEGQSVAVGTYVRPKLYMEYESAIGDRKDSVKLRYDLTRSIELQTETGENPGGDIFYKFER